MWLIQSAQFAKVTMMSISNSSDVLGSHPQKKKNVVKLFQTTTKLLK